MERDPSRFVGQIPVARSVGKEQRKEGVVICDRRRRDRVEWKPHLVGFPTDRAVHRFVTVDDKSDGVPRAASTSLVNQTGDGEEVIRENGCHLRGGDASLEAGSQLQSRGGDGSVGQRNLPGTSQPFCERQVLGYARWRYTFVWWCCDTTLGEGEGKATVL